ncbi:MAG: hypothetical protein AB2693_29995 [Candidatus Thiodiazotropha sp.]
MSNNSEINVYHYILDLYCQFEEKQFKGHITLFCRPVNHLDEGKSGKTSMCSQSSQSPFVGGNATEINNICSEQILCSQNENQEIDNTGGVAVNQEKGFAHQSKSKCGDDACTVVSWKRQKIFPPATDAKNQNVRNSGATNITVNDMMTGDQESVCESNWSESICKSSTQNIDSLNCSAVKRTRTESGNFEEINDLPSTVSSVNDSERTSISVFDRFAITNESNSNNVTKRENFAEEMPEEIRVASNHSSILREQDVLNENCCNLPNKTKNETDKTNQYGVSESVIEKDVLSDSEGSCPRLLDTVVSESQTCTENFIMILDCWDINVEKVEEIPVLNEIENIANSKMTYTETYKNLLSCSKCEGNSLCFHSDKRCVKIYKKGVKTADEFPRAIRISYSTHPKGHSLKWTKDQDGR